MLGLVLTEKNENSDKFEWVVYHFFVLLNTEVFKKRNEMRIITNVEIHFSHWELILTSTVSGKLCFIGIEMLQVCSFHLSERLSFNLIQSWTDLLRFRV